MRTSFVTFQLRANVASRACQELDASMMKDLLFWRDMWFGWQSLSTKIVGIGLICEGPELLREIISIIRRWLFMRRFHFSLPEEHIPEWVKFWAFVGWILIVVGVAGEWRTETVVSSANDDIQSFISINLVEAQKEAAFAIERAALANERAAKNEKEAAGLRKDARLLHQQNLSTEQELETERNTRDELEAALTPRMLLIRTGEKGSTNVDVLKAFAGMHFMIESLSDSEVKRAAGSLASAMLWANWVLVKGEIRGCCGDNADLPDGVEISYRTYPGIPTAESLADRSRGAAETLAAFLKDNKWDAPSMNAVFPTDKDDQLPANTVRIRVGLRQSTYFLPKDVKELIQNIDRQIEKRRRDLQKSRQKP